MDAPQVGALIRNAGALTGYGRDQEKEKKFPKIYDVYDAYEQAGRELVEYGKITNKRKSVPIKKLYLYHYLKSSKR